MVLCDLNIPWPCRDYTTPTREQLASLKATILMAQSLSYTHIAINFQIPQTVKIPKVGSNPIDLSFITADPNITLKVYTRLTLMIDDISNSVNLSRVSPFFDLVSIQPLTEKALLLSITQDIDIISFRFDDRLPCFLKHKLINSAVEKGIKFEIVYNPLYTINKKLFFVNTLSLIRSSRSRGLIISSGATTSLQLKPMFDITNLIIVLGLNHSTCLKSMTDIPLKVLLNGKLRNKSYKQLISIVDEEDSGKRKANSVLERQQKKFKK